MSSDWIRKAAEARPTPHCPRCGREAAEVRTKYGIRAECCGLWSWNRMPLADAQGWRITVSSDWIRKAAEARPTPHCPRCGREAAEVRTKYGIRAECCGLWSWNRMPLADAAAHESRKRLSPLLKEIEGAMTPGWAMSEIMKRMGVKDPRVMSIATMNEATAKKAISAAEDLIMDMMAGQIGMKK